MSKTECYIVGLVTGFDITIILVWTGVVVA